MAERNVNLLLSNAAQPSNGLANTNVIQWFGGRFVAKATGAFAGASAEIMVCAKAPAGGKRAHYATNAAEYDWISLHTFTAPGEFVLDNLNPCALAIKVTNSAGTSRIQVLVSPDA
jgi:hypothetical protein